MFTVTYLSSLKPKKTPKRYYEKSARKGFGIQVSPKGTKTFFLAYKTLEGKQRFMKLGVFRNNKNLGKMSLEEAGKQWSKWKSVREEGRDPQVVRDNENRAEQKTFELKQKKELKLKQQGTYEQLLNAYLEYLKTNKKASYKETKRALNANAYTVIPKSTKAKKVTSENIHDTLAIIEARDKHVMSNRVRAYISAAFNRSIKANKSRGTSEIAFGVKKNPVENVAKSEVDEIPGERFLTPSELRTLWYGLDQTRMPLKTKATIKLMLATGQRVQEVLRFNINEICFAENLWELDKTKPKRPHVIPLADLALEIIRGLKPDENGNLLSSDVTGDLRKPGNINQAVGRILGRLELEKFTPRDLRRTWKTLSGKAGISKFHRDKFQNHTTYDTSSKHYDRYDYLYEKRNVAKIWDNFLTKILNNEENVNSDEILESNKIISLLANLREQGVSEKTIMKALLED